MMFTNDENEYSACGQAPRISMALKNSQRLIEMSKLEGLEPSRLGHLCQMVLNFKGT